MDAGREGGREGDLELSRLTLKPLVWLAGGIFFDEFSSFSAAQMERYVQGGALIVAGVSCLQYKVDSGPATGEKAKES